VVDVLRSVLTVHCTLRLTSIGDVVPASFSLIGEKHVGTIVPSQPSPHLLGEVPDLILGLFVDPVSHGAFEAITMGVDLCSELTLESWENIIEGEGVGGKVHPA